MSSQIDTDLLEPESLHSTNKANIEKEGLEQLILFSKQQQINIIAEDTKEVNKQENYKNMRKSEGYRRFISKFKK